MDERPGNAGEASLTEEAIKRLNRGDEPQMLCIQFSRELLEQLLRQVKYDPFEDLLADVRRMRRQAEARGSLSAAAEFTHQELELLERIEERKLNDKMLQGLWERARVEPPRAP
jgi:hypothetical protein